MNRARNACRAFLFALVALTALVRVAVAEASAGTGMSTARDLGEGLVYLRAAATGSGDGAFALPALPTDEAHAQAALILDLRYTAGGESAGASTVGASEAQHLRDWLGARAAASPAGLPLFVLVNAETAPTLRVVAVEFAQNFPALLIGPAGTGDISLDIVLAINPEEERAAYAALASGEVEVAALIGEAAADDKRRYDEAAMIAAHTAPEGRAGTRAQRQQKEPPPPAKPQGPRSSDAAAPADTTQSPPESARARPVDLALQRAIHLYRAWRVFVEHP